MTSFQVKINMVSTKMSVVLGAQWKVILPTEDDESQVNQLAKSFVSVAQCKLGYQLMQSIGSVFQLYHSFSSRTKIFRG